MNVSVPLVESFQSIRRPNEQSAVGGLFEPRSFFAVRRLPFLNCDVMFPKRAKKLLGYPDFLKSCGQIVELRRCWTVTQGGSCTGNIQRQFGCDFTEAILYFEILWSD